MSKILPITTITELQRKPREVFDSISSYKVVLSNNEEIGVIMNIKAFKELMPTIIDENLEYSDFLIDSINQAEEDKRNGKLKTFNDVDSAIAFLDTL